MGGLNSRIGLATRSDRREEKKRRINTVSKMQQSTSYLPSYSPILGCCGFNQGGYLDTRYRIKKVTCCRYLPTMSPSRGGPSSTPPWWMMVFSELPRRLKKKSRFPGDLVGINTIAYHIISERIQTYYILVNSE